MNPTTNNDLSTWLRELEIKPLPRSQLFHPIQSTKNPPSGLSGSLISKEKTVDRRSRGSREGERLRNHLGVGPGVEREEGVLHGAYHLLRRRWPQPRRHPEEEGHGALAKSPRRSANGGEAKCTGTLSSTYGVGRLWRPLLCLLLSPAQLLLLTPLFLSFHSWVLRIYKTLHL
jgi:hypothetical protein